LNCIDEKKVKAERGARQERKRKEGSTLGERERALVNQTVILAAVGVKKKESKSGIETKKRERKKILNKHKLGHLRLFM